MPDEVAHTSSAREGGLELAISAIKAAYDRRQTSVPLARYSETNPAVICRTREIQRRTLSLLKRVGTSELGHLRVLDVGCGTGYWLRNFLQWGAEPNLLFGVDLLQERLDRARDLSDSGVTLVCGSAHQLSFCSGYFDLICQSTVFSSVLNSDLRLLIAAEMKRVLRPGGLILWYDFFLNNPWNPDVRGVRKSEIRRLFPNCEITIERLTVAPPLARIVSRCAVIYRAMAATRVLSTHYLAAIRKVEQSPRTDRQELLPSSKQ